MMSSRLLGHTHNMRILGIDPGYGRVGWGIIERTSSGGMSCVAYGCIESNPADSMPQRLEYIYMTVRDIVSRFQPARVHIETLYFKQNVTTGIAVAQARGVIMVACQQAGLPLSEFSPSQVKLAVTGSGRATKQQVQRMIVTLLRLQSIPQPDDAADALAIAIAG